MQADPILNELVSKVKQFERYTRQRHGNANHFPNHSDAHKEESGGLSNILLAFQSEQEIDNMMNSRDSRRLKVNVRNALGVRHHFFTKGS